MGVKERQKQLDIISAEILKCRICKKDKIGVAVPGEGSANAKVVFIGEAPGKEEAKTGRPFIGRSGKLLRQLISDAGLKEKDIYITSPVKYLPKYVTPTLSDVEHGRRHLFKQLSVIKPKIIVLLGRVASLAVLEKNIAVSKEHGKIVIKDGRKYLIAFHPAAPLYSPRLRAEITKDFKKLKTLL